MKFEVCSFVLLFVCWFFFVHNKLVLHYIIMLASSIKPNYNYCTYTLFVVSVNISHCASRSLKLYCHVKYGKAPLVACYVIVIGLVSPVSNDCMLCILFSFCPSIVLLHVQLLVLVRLVNRGIYAI